MLAFIVLFTIFVGLVGLLAAIGEFQKRHYSSKHSDITEGDSLDQLRVWLTDRNKDLPTPQQVTTLLNDSLKEFPSKEWKELKLEVESKLPTLIVSSVSSLDQDRIQFLCGIESVPGVNVTCINQLGEKILCHMQVEWMYATALVTFNVNNERLTMSFEHKEPVKMGLSCATEGDVEDADRLASSVADDFQMWFASLKIDDAAFHGPIPSVLVSAHDSDDNTMGNDKEKPFSDTNQSQCSTEPLLGEMAASEGHQGQWESTNTEEDPVRLEVLPVEEEEVKAQAKCSESAGLMNGGHHEQQNEVFDVRPPPLSVVPEEVEEERGNTVMDETSPTSPTWRRSPSYEQLQPLDLDPKRLLQSSSSENHASPHHLVSPDRRALTLSVSGSEAESIYGADERIPSTLVFEVVDSPTKVRHIVAVTPSHAVKLRRRYPHARKIHVYNDHCFTASHIKKRLECGVCGSKISGLFGKQAYICQDCTMVVHKHCHFKVEGQCSESQLQHMNLIYPDNTSTASAN